MFCLFSLIGFSQINQKTVENDEGWYTYSYHQNGEISTIIFQTKLPGYGAQGYAKAFNYQGELIYEASISRSGLYCSVRFTYFENGTVKSARYSSHPDGGIQWHKKETFFNEKGQKTAESEENWDDFQKITDLPVEE